MREDELETTTLLTTMMIEQDSEDEDIISEIEEFEDRIDYLDIDIRKKEKLKQMCEEIKKEKDEKTREYLFDLLQKEID